MLVKYLICIGICLTLLFFSLFLFFICKDRLDECEEQEKGKEVFMYAVFFVIGFWSSIASGMGTIILGTQTLAKFLQG